MLGLWLRDVMQGRGIASRVLGGVCAATALAVTGCGRASAPEPATAPAAITTPAAPSALTAWEETHGIGPVKEPLKLDAVNAAVVESGRQAFEMKCAACHKMDERYVGPALRMVTERRSPEYIMNMILNPAEMITRHPEAKKLFAEHLVPMTFQNVSMEEARTLLEYLRSENAPKS